MNMLRYSTVDSFMKMARVNEKNLQVTVDTGVMVSLVKKGVLPTVSLLMEKFLRIVTGEILVLAKPS